MLPPTIRSSLLNDDTFLNRWQLPSEIVATIGIDGPQFVRGRLNDGLRTAINNSGIAVSIPDREGKTWTLAAELHKPYQWTCELQAEDLRYSLDNLSALADEERVRTEWFESVATSCNLAANSRSAWLARLRQSPLSDTDFSDLMSELARTPDRYFRSLRAKMERRSFGVGDLVPTDSAYYATLVGSLSTNATAEEYVESSAGPLIDGLLRLKSSDNLIAALAICTSSSLSAHISLSGFALEEIARTFEWLASNGDPISRAAGVEVALNHLDTFPQLAVYVEQLVANLIAADPTPETGDLWLFCSLVVVVDWELSRRRTLGTCPPFYRRQAAICQACLLFRAVREANLDRVSLAAWLRESAAIGNLHMQGLIDLRLEPRWLPSLLDARQLRAEAVGRISNAANANLSKLHGSALMTLLVGQDSAVINAAPWPFPFFPGPLEGEFGSNPAPESYVKSTREALDAVDLQVSAFNALINLSMVFTWPLELAELTAAALKRVGYLVEGVQSQQDTLSLANGLAIVAATTRGQELARSLRVLARGLRRRKGLRSLPSTELRLAMTAAAAFADRESWAAFAGEWLTEIAFEATDGPDAREFLLQLRCLERIDPELAQHCAKADAAIEFLVR